MTRTGYLAGVHRGGLAVTVPPSRAAHPERPLGGKRSTWNTRPGYTAAPDRGAFARDVAFDPSDDALASTAEAGDSAFRVTPALISPPISVIKLITYRKKPKAITPPSAPYAPPMYPANRAK